MSSLPCKPVLLVVAEDVQIAESLSDGLAHGKYEVRAARDAGEAREILATGRVAVVIGDMEAAHLPGVDLLPLVQAASPETPVVFLAGQGSVRIAVEAMHEGAFAFLIKPCSSDHLVMVARRAIEMGELRAEVRRLRAGSLAVAGAASPIGEADEAAASPAIAMQASAGTPLPLLESPSVRRPPVRPAEPEDPAEKLDEHARAALLRALEAHNWNYGSAARALGIGRSALYAKARELGLRKA